MTDTLAQASLELLVLLAWAVGAGLGSLCFGLLAARAISPRWHPDQGRASRRARRQRGGPGWTE